MYLCKTVAFALTLIAATAAQAGPLTFDDLAGSYGDGPPLGSNMTGNGQYIAYSEGGYVLTLQTANAASEVYGAHIGDATGEPGTFNWHDDGNNLVGAFVTLTKVGGGKFNLLSFDYANYGDLGVSNGTVSTMLDYGVGNFAAGYRGVTSVTFTSSNNSINQLDNFQFTAGVPEPATWALMIAGFGMIGFGMRRRAAVATA